MTSEHSSAPKGAPYFGTTHWSVVLAAGQLANPAAADALEKLCLAYWRPLYVYVRRLGNDEDSAKDLTQSFFARLLEKNYVGQADRRRGKFRSFLLAALKHFLADEWDKTQAQKRGGGKPLISLDDPTAEDHYRLEPVDGKSPDKLFDRQWALATLEQASARLRKEYHDAGNGELFRQLQEFLSGARAGTDYAGAAAEYGMTESTLKSYVRRLRLRHRAMLREVIVETVTTTSEVDEELRDLLAALSEG